MFTGLSFVDYLPPKVPAKVTPPDHLPDPDSLLEFDVDEIKKEIFEAVRERVKSKAQCECNIVIRLSESVFLFGTILSLNS